MQPLTKMQLVGFTLTIMAAVEFAYAGLKLILQFWNAPGVSVTVVELLDTSCPITTTKGSVVIAGQGLVTLLIYIVTLAIAWLVGMALEIVKLLPVIEVVKVAMGLSLMSRVVRTGAVTVRLYCAGKTIMMVDPAGTGCEAKGVGLRLTS